MRALLKSKSFELAIAGVNFYKYLVLEKKEFIMSKQFLRSITSVGANVREAINAQSKLDFIHKLAIAQKECDETLYWLEIMNSIDLLTKNEFDSLYADALALLKMIRSSILTIKKKRNNS